MIWRVWHRYSGNIHSNVGKAEIEYRRVIVANVEFPPCKRLWERLLYVAVCRLSGQADWINNSSLFLTRLWGKTGRLWWLTGIHVVFLCGVWLVHHTCIREMDAWCLVDHSQFFGQSFGDQSSRVLQSLVDWGLKTDGISVMSVSPNGLISLLLSISSSVCHAVLYKHQKPQTKTSVSIFL